MSKSILNIEKGAIITRVQRSDNGDGSYMGDNLKFVGIANNQIYFQNLTRNSQIIFGEDRIFNVPLDYWEFGWEYWIDPQTLFETLEDRGTLQMRLEKALLDEDYIKAEKIRKQLL